MTIDKSSTKSFRKSVSLPSRQRMHSPTACATMRNEVLLDVMGALQGVM